MCRSTKFCLSYDHYRNFIYHVYSQSFGTLKQRIFDVGNMFPNLVAHEQELFHTVTLRARAFEAAVMGASRVPLDSTPAISSTT